MLREVPPSFQKGIVEGSKSIYDVRQVERAQCFHFRRRVSAGKQHMTSKHGSQLFYLLYVYCKTRMFTLTCALGVASGTLVDEICVYLGMDCGVVKCLECISNSQWEAPVTSSGGAVVTQRPKPVATKILGNCAQHILCLYMATIFSSKLF